MVLERANDVGTGTSKANTAIVHTGFDADPGSLESSLVRRGHELLTSYADASGIALERTGAVLVAWNADQAARLDGMLAKARANGYERASRMELEELRRREPHLEEGATGAVAIPDESIICPWSTSIAFATEAVGAGVDLRLGTEVTDVGRDDDDWLVHTSSGPIRSNGSSTQPAWPRTSSTAASATTNSPSRRVGANSSSSTSWPARSCPRLCCPSPTSGRRACWWRRPSTATCSWARRRRTWRTERTPPPRPRVSPPCSRRVAAYSPSWSHEEVTATYAGIRAATEHRDYQITVHERERYACVGGIRSTGLTASLAIAEHVVEQMGAGGLPLAEAEQEPEIPHMPELGEDAARPFEDAPMGEPIRPTATSCASASG